MKRNKKHTASFFLLIAGLAILFHALIPHDHHYDNRLESNHENHQHNDTTEHESLHCYFFNDALLNIDSASDSDNTLVFIDFYSTTSCNEEVVINYKSIASCSEFNQVVASVFRDASPTRGSPLNT